MDILAKIKVAQPAKVYVRSVRKWVIMQVYARQNPAMIQQLGTNQVVERKSGETKYLEEVVEEDMEDDEVLGIFAMKKCAKDGHTPIYVSVMLGQRSCKMQLDTEATVSILPKVLYDQQFNQWPLRATKIS